ncbi:hypothetical protein EJB05_17238, partial [Eragrostis curvula]
MANIDDDEGVQKPADGLDDAWERRMQTAQDARRDPRHLQAWCLNGGEVVVSYAGVALAWGQVPGFCVPRKEVREFILLLWGRGVGLSEDLHRRLASELLTGTTQVLAEMKLSYDANHWTPSEAYNGTFQLMLA